MKIKNIKTNTEFYEMADIWYQRTIELKNVATDNNRSYSERLKALKLWFIMVERVKKLINIAIELSKPKHYFKSVGLHVIKEGNIEFINTDNSKLSIHDIGYKIINNPNYKP